MRSWRKWGGLLAGLACAAIAQASDLKPIEDKNAFEKQYIECIMSGVRNNCMVSLIGERLCPEAKNESDADMIGRMNKFDASLRDFIGKNGGAYKVHTADKVIKASIYENRTYIVELGNGGVMGFRVIFRQMQGKRYVESAKATGDRGVIAKLLGLLSSNEGDF